MLTLRLASPSPSYDMLVSSVSEPSISLDLPAGLNVTSPVLDVPVPAPRTFLPFNGTRLVTRFRCNRAATTSMRVELVEVSMDDVRSRRYGLSHSLSLVCAAPACCAFTLLLWCRVLFRTGGTVRLQARASCTCSLSMDTLNSYTIVAPPK